MDSADTTKIKERIIDILDRLFSDSGIDKDILEYVDLIDDLGMDSITFVTTVIEIETAFGIKIPDDLLLLDNFRYVYMVLEIVKNEMIKRGGLE